MSGANSATNVSETLAYIIAKRAGEMPDQPAYLGAGEPITWSQYHAASDRLARILIGLGFEPGERLAVLLPDGPGVHVAFVGAEKAGLVVVGIGARTGLRELRHLLQVSGACALLSEATHRGRSTRDLVVTLRDRGLALRHHLVGSGDLREDEPILVDDRPAEESTGGSPAAGGARRLGPDDLFLLNSTSGTTGMPKCVMHHQRRWQSFHRVAVQAARLSPSDIFMSVVPAPFGFGIWTAHFSPTLLGVPTVLLPKFSAERALESIERHGVTVLAAVTTQFIMMINSPEIEERDLSSLRVLFTGGERVPAERAAAFEEKTGARVLQFYGSNEAGALSGTTLDDPPERRLHSAGRVIPEMNVRLFDADGSEVSIPGRGRPGCKGPLTSPGYYGDDEANTRLFRSDGWMLVGDLVEIESDGTLRVIGRTDDFIIRGGKNISAAAVEEVVANHPAVALAAAVAMPDEVFGERVCVFVELQPERTLSLDELVADLIARDVSKEILPERLVVLKSLPRSAGDKVAKATLRKKAQRLARREAN
jgi:acyl-CoA synthetase